MLTHTHMYTQNLEAACNPTVTKSKPKVEPPKDDQAKQGEGEGGTSQSEETSKMEEDRNKQEGKKEEEAKMDEDPKPTEPEDMDID